MSAGKHRVLTSNEHVTLGKKPLHTEKGAPRAIGCATVNSPMYKAGYLLA